MSWPVTLVDPLGGELSGHAIFPNAKEIIAWVEHTASKTVIQAGSTMLDATPAPTTKTSTNKSRQAQFGGSR